MLLPIAGINPFIYIYYLYIPVNLKGLIKLFNFNGTPPVKPGSILTSLVIALVPAIIIILIQPVDFKRFSIKPIYLPGHRLYWFEDLENDGKKERLYLGFNPDSSSYMYINNDKDEIIDQFNFRHGPARSRRRTVPVSVDIDADSIKEIVLFSQNYDSLFMDIFSFKQLSTLVESRFITTIGGFNNKDDYNIRWIGERDVNGDNVTELFFIVTAGFSLYPRAVYRYDIANDSLIMSVNTGSGDLSGSMLADSGETAIIVTGKAFGNTYTDYPFPYHDTCCWVFGYDTDLNFTFEPLSLGNNPSRIHNIVEEGGSIYFLFSANNNSGDRNMLVKFDERGFIVDTIGFDIFLNFEIKEINFGGKHLYYISGNDYDNFYFLDINEFRLYSNRLSGFINHKRLLSDKDIDNDGSREYILQEVLGKDIYLASGKLSKPVVIPFDEYIYSVTSAWNDSRDGNGEMIFITERMIYSYRIDRNPLFRMKYLLWSAIYILSALFVYFILYLQRVAIEKEQQVEREIAALQLQNIRNQLDPHFTFNALNSVGNAIYNEDKEVAYDMFERFVRMIRSSLLFSDKIFRPLADEIQFTRDYLEFQKRRFRERFDFEILIDEDVYTDKIKVPKMIVQGYVENSAKHAFDRIDYRGMIKVLVSKREERTFITIDDNGIGIKQSKREMTTSGTRRGEYLLNEQIKQINNLYKSDISIEIFDKSDLPGGETGTRVIIGMISKY